MIRVSVLFTLLFCGMWFVTAETVSLSGTVVMPGSSAGVAGVKVSLTKQPSLSTTTSADGSFILSGTFSVQPQTHTKTLTGIYAARQYTLRITAFQQRCRRRGNVFERRKKECIDPVFGVYTGKWDCASKV